MMKRRIPALLCALVLLLAGCSTRGETSAPPSVPATSAAPTSAPQPPATEPTQPAPGTETVPGTELPPEPSGQSVTPGGFRVYTDSSQYTPYEPPKALYTRPTGVDLHDFHPENAHGAVYPYVASHIYNSSEDGYSYQCGRNYGFMDSTGTIVTDGTYQSVEPLQEYDYTTGELEYRLPLWVVSRIENASIVQEEDGYEYVDGDTFYGVVAMDGSFSIPCEYRGINALDGRFACIRDWETRSFSVFDVRGNLLLTSSQISDGKPVTAWDINYSEGLYVVGLHDYNSTEESRYYYLDESGNRVLGPYSEAEPFSEGLAVVSMDDGDTYGVIDKTGRWMIRPDYDFLTQVRNGQTIASLGDRRAAVLDQNGNRLFSTENGWIEDVRCGYQVRYEEDGEDYSSFYDRNGNLLGAFSGSGWECLSENVISTFEDVGTRYVALDHSVPDVIIPNADWSTRCVAVIDGRLQLGFSCYDSATRKTVVISEDLTTVTELPDDVGVARPDIEGILAVPDQVRGDLYYILREGSKYLYYAADGTLACTSDDYDRIIDGGLLTDSGLVCTFRSFNGELRFSYPLTDTGD